MDSDQQKHLEMIQGVITRMAGNSFMIRGWSVTLISALFALAAKDSNADFVIISYFPAAFFWFLDGYYLSQERKFRSLYDVIRKQEKTDFSMKTAEPGDANDSWGSSLLSKTMLLFHLGIIGVIIVVMGMLWK